MAQLPSIKYLGRTVWQIRPFTQFMPQHRQISRSFDPDPYIASPHTKNLQIDANTRENNPIVNTTR
jgi:hypothetical protein